MNSRSSIILFFLEVYDSDGMKILYLFSWENWFFFFIRGFIGFCWEYFQLLITPVHYQPFNFGHSILCLPHRNPWCLGNLIWSLLIQETLMVHDLFLIHLHRQQFLPFTDKTVPTRIQAFERLWSQKLERHPLVYDNKKPLY